MSAAIQAEARLSALLHANQAVGSSLELDEVLNALVREAAAISGAPTVRLFLLDEAAQILRCRVAVGFPSDVGQALTIPVGVSFSGQVARTGAPLAIPDTRTDPQTHFPTHTAQYAVVSYLGLPVKTPERLVGVLVFNTPEPREYSPDEIAFLCAFAQQAALALHHASLHQAALRRTAELEALLKATDALMSGVTLEGILEQIVVQAAQISGAPHVKVLLVDRAAQCLRVGAARGSALHLGDTLSLVRSSSGMYSRTLLQVIQSKLSLSNGRRRVSGTQSV